MAATRGEAGASAVSERPAPLAGAGPQSAPEPTTRVRTRLRVHHGELTSAVSALALLGLMFLTKWYGVAGVPDPSAARPAISTAVNGFNGLTLVRWLLLVTICAALGSVVLHASQRKHGTQTDTSRLLTVLGSLSALLLIYRVLIDLPSASRVTDQKLGAVLGLLCALGIALGGWQSMLERKHRPRVAPRPSASRPEVASRPPEL